ncbi:hypothetical protein N7494_003719 [Penicillium frequentans]|uniref:Uncharacterized protein n=1 Tax=Penicillium frequentans TaxID=3151616 RepID=A0AAD6GI07_9EURO|nr:hypothetical protein N7494_003719 [Penicillium glabrum]
MVWFPLAVDNEAITWSFDIVGLLAVVGGSSIEKHAQSITASPLAGFPRLLPAPETMLDTDRPDRLPSVKDVTVVGVHSGNQFNELNFFADVIHRTGGLKSFQFQSFRITYRQKDPEENGSFLRHGVPPGKAIIPLHTFSSLNLLTLISVLITIALFVWAGVQHDAVAILGLGTMSISTATACLSAQWRPILSVRAAKGIVPPGDVVIRTRNGAFVAIECSEEIARELYAGTEECSYVYNGRTHQCLLAISTVLLMASIIFFSNCGWKIQIAVGLAYIILNLAYWALALLTEPQELWNWESRYQKEELVNEICPNYTVAMWKAIQTTGNVRWVKKAGFAPATKKWNGWLKEAKENCTNKEWDPEAARDRWMQKDLEEEKED